MGEAVIGNKNISRNKPRIDDDETYNGQDQEFSLV